MSGHQLLTVLTEIRDQQKQQIANFERALKTQAESAAIQRQGRKLFTFMVFAPWAALVFVLGMMLFSKIPF